jgi:NitT/TauT family transport system substrate-binding protein
LILKRFNSQILVIISLSGLLLGACVNAHPPAESEFSSYPLKIAILPILDSLPMLVAQKEGYFEARGLQVELIPVASGAERDQLVASGQADGMVNEILSTIFYNKEKTQVQIVRYARTADPQSPLFRILASKDSGIKDVNGLRGIEIGISEGTVIAYLTDRMLQGEGFKADDIKTVAVPKISDRMTLLNSGQLKAAMLPDPLSSLSAQLGAVIILDDTRYPDFSCSTIAFRKEIIDENPETIRSFLAAVERAVLQINSNPKNYTKLLEEQKLVPPQLISLFKLPLFVEAGVPSEEQFHDVLAWAKDKGLVAGDVPYNLSVNPDFLPQ